MMRAEFSHDISIPLPIEQAFPLFTPKGEEAWVPGWRPDYIAPASGETCEEMVFRTGSGEETTLWTCLTFAPDRHHVRYLRTTPASRMAFVDVQCRSEGRGRTAVRVAYRYLALSEKGDDFIAAMTAQRHAAMIGGWADLILAMIERSAGRADRLLN